jgi:type II secretory ATPase GspE/PulE/Tfp pilus assembly ATPase PilB-like protein
VGGFIGRTVVAEILTVNEAVKGMILNHQWALLEECLLVDQGYISFNGDAKRLIAEGTTSLQEVLRVLG